MSETLVKKKKKGLGTPLQRLGGASIETIDAFLAAKEPLPTPRVDFTRPLRSARGGKR